jgi:hypothetical protein
MWCDADGLISVPSHVDADQKNDQTPALGHNKGMIRSTDLRTTSAFNLPTCKTSLREVRMKKNKKSLWGNSP